VEEGFELVKEGEHAASMVEVGHVVVAARLEVDEQGGGAADGVDGVEGDGSGDSGVAAGDGHEVDDGVGGAADGLQDGDGVEERFTREEGLRPELGLCELHSEGSG